jgi:hypothetical protein
MKRQLIFAPHQGAFLIPQPFPCLGANLSMWLSIPVEVNAVLVLLPLGEA